MLTHNRIETEVVDVLLPIKCDADEVNPFPNVKDEPEFAKKVRLASVILKGNNPISYCDIRRATPGVYHRIALRIAAARFPNVSAITQNAEGSQSFQNNSSNINFQWLEDDVMAMLIPDGLDTAPNENLTATRVRAFSGALEWAASKLVAAHVVRNIPLNNSSLKFVDIADNLETQALEDVDRLIKIEQGSANGANTSTSADEAEGQVTLCLAHSVNPSTLPSSAFDVPDAGSSPATYTGAITPQNVEVYPAIPNLTDRLYYCHVYMTGQLPFADQDLIAFRTQTGLRGESQDSSAVSFAIRLNIPLQAGWTIDDIIIEMADAINSACLNPGIIGSNSNSTLSNILCVPNTGIKRTTSTTLSKKELYPDSTTNRNRTAIFVLEYQANCLDFTTRRYSNKVVTELFNVTFYSIIDPGSATPVDPTNNNSNTYFDTPLTIGTDDSLSKVKKLVRDAGYEFFLGVEGLVFGESQSYNTLNPKTPRGFFLTVQKGDKASVSVESTGGSSFVQPQRTDAEASNILDTLYFYAPDGTVFTENLTLRISSTDYKNPVEKLITVWLQPTAGPNFPTTIQAPFTETVNIGEAIAERVVDALYYYSRETNDEIADVANSNVLGVLLGDYERTYTGINLTSNTVTELPLEERMDGRTPEVFTPADIKEVPNEPVPAGLDAWQKEAKAGRVQLIGFKYTANEYNAVADVINVPPGLEIATGNFILRRSSWTNRRRSVQVDTQTLNSGIQTVTQTTAEELASVNASVGKVEASKSRLLQQVYDKLRLLDEAKKGFPTKWHSQT